MVKNSTLYLLGPRKRYYEGLQGQIKSRLVINLSFLQPFPVQRETKMIERKYKTCLRGTAQQGHNTASYSVKKNRAPRNLQK